MDIDNDVVQKEDGIIYINNDDNNDGNNDNNDDNDGNYEETFMINEFEINNDDDNDNNNDNDISLVLPDIGKTYKLKNQHYIVNHNNSNVTMDPDTTMIPRLKTMLTLPLIDIEKTNQKKPTKKKKKKKNKKKQTKKKKKKDIKIFCSKKHDCPYVDIRELIQKQKYIDQYEVDGKQRWCDVCDKKIKTIWFYHCSTCIYDVCQSCAKHV